MRIFYLIKKELIEIFRQKELLVLMFIAPIIQTIILGYVVTTDVKNVPVAVVNLSSSAHSFRITNRMVHSPLFKVKKISTKPLHSMELFKEGKVKAVIVLRDKKGGEKSGPVYPEIQVLMDGIDSNSSLIAAGYFNGLLRHYILNDMEEKGRKLPLLTKSLIRFNPGLKSINYMGPGIVALLLTIVAMFLTSLALVREKEQQTLDSLLVSRLTPVEIYLGKTLPMAILGLLEMTLGLVVVILIFRIPLRGNVGYLLLAAVIFLFCLLSYAFLISLISGSQQQALFFSWFSMITFLMLSGLLTPVENIPVAFRWLAAVNPLRYLIEIIRELFLKGNSIAYFYRELLIMVGITAVVFTFSLLNFKKSVVK